MSAAAACGGDDEFYLPELDGYATMILAADAPGGASGSAYALENGEPKTPIVLRRATGEPTPLRLYVYGETTVELGIEEGSVELAPEGTLAHPLRDAARVYGGEDRGEGAVDWIESARISPALWISGAATPTAPCPELHTHALKLPDSTWISVAVPIGGEAAMIATRHGEFFRVTTATVAPIRSLDERVPHGAGFADGEGVVWLTGCEGQLARVYPEDGFALEMDGSCDMGSWLDGESMIGLDGPRGRGLPEEFFGITRHGHFVHMKPPETEVLLDLARTIYFHYVSWVAAEEAIMVTRTPEVIWFRGGVLEMVAPVWGDSGTAPEITRAMLFPERGVAMAAYSDLAGSRFTMFDRASSTWRVFAEAKLGGPTYDLRPVGDGFVFAGSAGQAGVFSPATGFCATTIPELVFYYVVPVSERAFLLVGFIEAGNQDTDSIWWLTIGE